MVLGINYLTRERKGAKGEGKHFSSPEECILSVDARGVDYQARVKVKMAGEWVETTPGRIILNDNIPRDMGFLNTPMGEKELLNLIARCYNDKGPSVTVKMLDAVKDLGFKYATRFGATIGMDDIVIPGGQEEPRSRKPTPGSTRSSASTSRATSPTRSATTGSSRCGAPPTSWSPTSSWTS